MKYLFLISLPLYVLDQITKWAIQLNLELHSYITVIPGFFDLVYVTNTGAAFGSFKNSNPFFIGLSVVTLIILLICSFRGLFNDRLEQIGIGLLIAGILGNLTDRIVHKHVIDFLDFHIGNLPPWPAFNVADSCICVAVGVFIFHSLKTHKGSSTSK